MGNPRPRSRGGVRFAHDVHITHGQVEGSCPCRRAISVEHHDLDGQSLARFQDLLRNDCPGIFKGLNLTTRNHGRVCLSLLGKGVKGAGWGKSSGVGRTRRATSCRRRKGLKALPDRDRETAALRFRGANRNVGECDFQTHVHA